MSNYTRFKLLKWSLFSIMIMHSFGFISHTVCMEETEDGTKESKITESSSNYQEEKEPTIEEIHDGVIKTITSNELNKNHLDQSVLILGRIVRKWSQNDKQLNKYIKLLRNHFFELIKELTSFTQSIEVKRSQDKSFLKGIIWGAGGSSYVWLLTIYTMSLRVQGDNEIAQLWLDYLKHFIKDLPDHLTKSYLTGLQSVQRFLPILTKSTIVKDLSLSVCFLLAGVFISSSIGITALVTASYFNLIKSKTDLSLSDNFELIRSMISSNDDLECLLTSLFVLGVGILYAADDHGLNGLTCEDLQEMCKSLHQYAGDTLKRRTRDWLAKCKDGCEDLIHMIESRKREVEVNIKTRDDLRSIIANEGITNHVTTVLELLKGSSLTKESS
jgi:hypothetical protein